MPYTPAALTNTKVRTGKVRLSFVHLLEPFAMDEGDPKKYSCTILIPKSDKATLRLIKAAREAAIEVGKQRYGASWAKSSLWNTMKDGDETDLEKYPENEGHYVMSVSNNTRPGVVNTQLDPITDEGDIYSGCYAQVSIDAFPYDAKGNRGISFGLRNVMKAADGQAFGGVSRAEDDFEVVEDDEDDDLI